MKSKKLKFSAQRLTHHDLLSQIIATSPDITCEYDEEEYEDINILHQGNLIGTVDKNDLWRISGLVFRSNVQSIRLLSFSENFLQIELVLVSSLEDKNIPIPIDGKVSGIYKISIENDKYIYIGQSGDIRRRIEQHWTELSFGTHHNMQMQRLFDMDSLANHSIEILDLLLEKHTGDYEQQKFLGEREKYWIDVYKSGTHLLNRTSGEIVPTKKAIKEHQELSKQRDEKFDTNVKETRKKINTEIKSLEDQVRLHRVIEYDENVKAKEYEKFLFKNSGVIGFFFGNSTREELALIRDKLSRSRIRLNAINDVIQSIKLEIADLKLKRKRSRTTKEMGIKYRKFE